MKGLVELTDKEGKVVFECLIGLQTLIDFSKLNNMPFNQILTELSDKGDPMNQLKLFRSMIYCGIVNFHEYNETPFSMTEKKVYLTIDTNGLMTPKVLKEVSDAIVRGFEGFSDTKGETKKK